MDSASTDGSEEHARSVNSIEYFDPPTEGDRSVVSGSPKLVRRMSHAISRFVMDVVTVFGVVKAMARGYTDDKTYLGERIIQLVSGQLEGSRLGDFFSGLFVKTLWKDLQHPPHCYLGDEFKYRTADGHNNNVTLPNLGRAGSAYARSVTPMTQLPAALPDASTIFDALFAREGPAKEHPCKVSSMLFYMATIITHDLFLTNLQDPSKVDNSSYLDLSPLYGNSQSQQNSVRTFVDGRLKPDAFADTRILGLPPGNCVLLVCFNRFHNHIVEELAVINEGNKFGLPSGAIQSNEQLFQAALGKRDNDLFQTARLITCGLYIHILLFDYVRTILNLHRSSTSWNLDPRKAFFGVDLPIAGGNQTSVEFNLVYRWHSAVSAKDEEWTNRFFKDIFPDDIKEMSPEAFLDELRKWGQSVDHDPGRREFGGLHRGENGSFDNAELAEVLYDSTEDIAVGAFGARNVPIVLKAAEVLGIEQGRKWQVATLNEFRKYFKLKPHKTFLDINRDPDVAKSLETLYSHPDHVELYPGLVAEETKEPQLEGQGLCLGFTTSKTILSDAITLVRGDRFYTEDFNPASLTHWGFEQASSNPNTAGGGVIYKLLMKALPGFYRPNSVYALFPFTVPEENRKILQSLGLDRHYDFERPTSAEFGDFLPSPGGELNSLAKVPSHCDSNISMNSNENQVKPLTESSIFPLSPMSSPALHGTRGRTFSNSTSLSRHSSRSSLSMNDDALISAKQILIEAMQNPSRDVRGAIGNFYETSMSALVRRKSTKLRNTYQLDAVHDVINVSHTKFMRKIFGIPADGPDCDNSSRTQGLAACLSTELEALDTADSVGLRNIAYRETKLLRNALEKVCYAIKDGRSLSSGSKGEPCQPPDPLREAGLQLMRERLNEGRSVQEVVEVALAVTGAAVACQSRGSACALDVYLSHLYKNHWPDIERLARSNCPAAFEQLKKYALEAYFLATPVCLNSWGTSSCFSQRSYSEPVSPMYQYASEPASPLFQQIPFRAPSRRASEEIDLNRPSAFYEHLDRGYRSGLGLLVLQETLAAQLRVFGKLKNLRLAPGLQGQLKTKVVDGDLTLYMNESWTEWLPYPITKTVHFDDFGEV